MAYSEKCSALECIDSDSSARLNFGKEGHTARERNATWIHFCEKDSGYSYVVLNFWMCGSWQSVIAFPDASRIADSVLIRTIDEVAITAATSRRAATIFSWWR